MADENNGKPINFRPLELTPENDPAKSFGVRNEPLVLLEEENPYGSLVASVEDDGRTVYLYLNPSVDPSYQPAAVWIRNLGPAPEQTDVEAMRAGVAPRMKHSICLHPDGLPSPDPEKMKLIWFMEGNGVALEIDGELAGLIPPWAGHEGLFGYAKETLGKDAGTVPFPVEKDGLLERVEEGRRFQENLQDPAYWESFRDRLLTHYENTYGPHVQYFAVNNEYLPIVGIAQFRKDDKNIYATIGMSMQNMPSVELAFKEPDNHMRMELIAIREDEPDWIAGILANMAIHPWRANSFFARGHSYESGYAKYEKSDFILTDSFGDPTIHRPADIVLDERYPVKFLYAVGLTPEQKDELKHKGNEAFLNEWENSQKR